MDTTRVQDHDDDDTRDKAPHGCYDGYVFIGHRAVDPETGEEVEVFESVPCRRCADRV